MRHRGTRPWLGHDGPQQTGRVGHSRAVIPRNNNGAGPLESPASMPGLHVQAVIGRILQHEMTGVGQNRFD